MSLTLRRTKGSELTHDELDTNLLTLYQLAEAAQTLAEAAQAATEVDHGYVKSVNGVVADSGGNVFIPVATLSGPEFTAAVEGVIKDLDFAPHVPAVGVTTPADFFVSGNVLTSASTPTGTLRILNYSVPTTSVPSGITYTAGVSSTTNPLGTFQMNVDGSWTLTPKIYTSGVQSAIKYTVSNGLTTSVGTLTFNLVWHNHAPVTNPDNVTVVEDSSVQINVLANDVEWDGHSMTVTHIHESAVTPGGPAVPVPNGTATLASNGATITFTPTTGYSGLVSFNYTVVDSYAGASGPLSSVGVVNVLVSNPSNLATSNYATGKAVLITFNFAANPLQKNQTIQEPVTGATVKRITDVTQDFPGQVALYNAYSRYPTENATEEYCLAFAGNSTSCLVIDRASGSVVAALAYDNTGIPSHSIGAYHEVRWHYTLAHPYRVYFVRDQQFWLINDVRDQANTRQLVKDFSTVIDWTGTPSGALRKIYMDQEGNSSLDSDHWAWMAAYYNSTSGVWVVRAYVHYQVSTDTVHTMYPQDLLAFTRIPGNEETLVTFRHRPNAVEMVPDGSGLLIHSERAYGGNKDEYIGTIFEAPYIFPLDFNPATLTPFRVASDATHSGWSTVGGVWHYVSQDNRRDTWCAVPVSGPNKGYGNEGYIDVFAALGSGVIDFYIDNDAFYPGMHFGVCTNAADGWTLVSTYATQTASTYGMANADFLMQIKPAAEAIYWKVSPSFNQYPAAEKQDWNESPGSINLAGTRVYTCGDWNGTLPITPDGKGRYCDLYTVDLPTNWAAQFTPQAPVKLTDPTLAGTATQGQTLTRTSGTYSGFPPPTLTGVWQKDGADIGGATSPTYVLQASDVGSQFRYKEVATNSSGSVFAYTAATAQVVAIPIPVSNTLPTITGSAQEGATLTNTSPGTWTNSPTGYSRQWYRGASAVSGATGTDYQVLAADIGYQISVRVVASNSYGSSVAASSTSTSVVVADPGTISRASATVSTDPSPGSNATSRVAAAFDALAGALIVVSVDWNTNGGTNTGVTVTDTAGNTYTEGTVVAHTGLNGRCQQFWCLSSAAQVGNVVTATNGGPSTPLNVSVVQYTASTGSTWTRTASASAGTDYVPNPVATSAFDMAANSVAVGHWFDLYGLSGTVVSSDALVHTVQGTSWTLERIRGQAATATTASSSCTGNSYTRMAASVQVFTRT